MNSEPYEHAGPYTYERFGDMTDREMEQMDNVEIDIKELLQQLWPRETPLEFDGEHDLEHQFVHDLYDDIATFFAKLGVPEIEFYPYREEA